MINIKKLTAIALAISLITTTALASVLGTETYSATEIEVAEGTTYVNNVFISDQSGVGKQTENYYIYKPNDSVKPVVVNDTYLYGKTKVSAMLKKMQEQGMYPLMVMNSDFFSLQTGVPMGHQVADGIVITKDSEGEDALGIRKDGSAFMSWLGINTTVTINSNNEELIRKEMEAAAEAAKAAEAERKKNEQAAEGISDTEETPTDEATEPDVEEKAEFVSTVGKTISVENVNKYPQPYTLYMLTDRFSDTTRHAKPSYNVIIGSLSDELKLNEDITGVVEQIVVSDEPIAIPKGKIVITADKTISPEKMEQIKLLRVGDGVTINNTATGDSRWGECIYIQGSVGGRLIKDGTIQNIDQDAAPRSAVGIKKDGSIIFYTIDGRQTGHSYGLRLKTLAKRLNELGCVDAINFDGGGSTCIAGIYPGASEGEVLNKPSDGAERSVATFLALVNTREPSGIPHKLHLTPAGGNYLSGATAHFTVKATDTNDHPVKFNEEVTYISEGSTYVSTDGVARIIGNGKVTVTATSGDIKGSADMTVFSTPDTITLYDLKKAKAIKSLALGGEETIQISASATVGSKKLISDNGCYNWSVEGNIGEINSDGIFTSTKANATGNIVVTAGNKTVKLPVTVNGDKYAGYTKMEFSHSEDAVEITFTNLDGITVEKENISISVDGKKSNFKYDGETVTVPLMGEKEKKITIAVTNSGGHRSIKTYTVPGKQYDNQFIDTSNHWAGPVISYMSERKIVNGIRNENGTYSFNPDMNMTRAEFAVMTANYLGVNPADYKVLTVPFTDVDELPTWAATQIKALYTMGIMNGKTQLDGTVSFDSTAKVTRAEVVTVLTRMLGESIETQEMDYTDIADVPAYAAEGFATMISMGIISGYDDGTLKPNRNITRAEAVKMIYGIY